MIHREAISITASNQDGTVTTSTHVTETEVEPTWVYDVEHRRCRKHKHRTANAHARCLYRYAEWVAGEGRWATLAGCGVLTIVLHRTKEEALAALAAIDTYGCGHRCPVVKAWARHRLVLLGDPGRHD